MTDVIRNTNKCPRLNFCSFFSDVAAPRENSGPESETYGTFVKKFQNLSNRKTSVSLPEILRQTTMEEFLEAVERVQASQLLTEDFSGSNINNGGYFSIILNRLIQYHHMLN